MKLRRQLERWQLEWARRHGIRLQARPGAPAGAVERLEDNLFEPLDEAAANQFVRGSGGELERPGGKPGHLHSLLSSAALCVNFFQHWRLRPKRGLLEALGVGLEGPAALDYEARLPVLAGWKTHPHADALLSSAGAAPWTAAVECKFGEPYDGKPRRGLAYAHSRHRFFREWPALGALASAIAPADSIHRHLHAAQLLKQLLGLRTKSPSRFLLVYLWFDVDGPSGRRHRQEAEDFAARARADGVGFLPLSCQELWMRLACFAGGESRPWLEYLRERYWLDRLITEEP
jgi:hypothetical protein